MQRPPGDPDRDARIRELARAMRHDLLARRDLRSRLAQAARFVSELYAGKPRAWRSGSGFEILAEELAETISRRELERMMHADEVWAETAELQTLPELESLQLEHLCAVRRLPIETRTALLKQAAVRGTSASAFRASFSPTESPSRPGRPVTPPDLKWLQQQPPEEDDGAAITAFNAADPEKFLAAIARARSRLRTVEEALFRKVTATLGRPPCILLIDDEQSARTALCRVLMRLGVEVRECATAEDALALAPGQGDAAVIAVLLRDVSTDGIALGRQLRDRGIVRRLVFVSSYVEQMDRARSEGIGSVVDRVDAASELALVLVRSLMNGDAK